MKRMSSLRVSPPSNGNTILLLRGKPTCVEVMPDESLRRPARIVEIDNRIVVRVPPGRAANSGRALEAWLRRQARYDLLVRLSERSHQMRVCHDGRLYIRGQRTRWGSCSGKKNLSFNWRLVMAPPEVLDYIVVHELAHLAEPNHSPKFWLIVRSHCPEFERHRRWLKENEDRLKQLPDIHRPVEHRKTQQSA